MAVICQVSDTAGSVAEFNDGKATEGAEIWDSRAAEGAKRERGGGGLGPLFVVGGAGRRRKKKFCGFLSWKNS